MFTTQEIILLLTRKAEYLGQMSFLKSEMGKMISIEGKTVSVDEFKEKQTCEVAIEFRPNREFADEELFEKARKRVEVIEDRDFGIQGSKKSINFGRASMVSYEAPGSGLELMDNGHYLLKGRIELPMRETLGVFLDGEVSINCYPAQMEIQFLTTMVDLFSKNKIYSEKVQEILLGQRKIKEVRLDPSKKSKYEGMLDESQRKAFNAALSDNDILVIKGPPGTGKTRVITALIKHFKFEDKSNIIMAAQAHQAIDNVIEGISVTKNSGDSYTGLVWSKSSSGDSNKEFTNIGRMTARNLRERLLSEAPKGGSLARLLKGSHNGRAGVNKFIGHSKWVQEKTFFSTVASNHVDVRFVENKKNVQDSVLFMDEVSRLSIMDVIRFTPYAKKILLFGDDRQLPPINSKYGDSYDSQFRKMLKGRDEELYMHLFEDSIFYKIFDDSFKEKIQLTTNYRSDESVLKLFNEISYDNILKSDQRNIVPISFKGEGNLQKAIVNNKTVVLDVNFKGADLSASQAKVLGSYVENIYKTIENRKSIDVSVLFFLRKDLIEFRNRFNDEIYKWSNGKTGFKSFKFGTVDQMQGTEAHIVFVGGSKNIKMDTSNIRYVHGIQSVQRVNVALSRAKNSLVWIKNADQRNDISLWDSVLESKTKHRLRDVFQKFGLWQTVNVNEVDDE